jgi:hypothetical protein
MGFIVTAPTAVPVDGDGSQDQETWGESGGPFSVPAEEDGGLGAQVLAANTVNYIAQKSGRWSRATSDRMARSDEGLLSSCVLSQGTWNTGAATLDVTLTPSRVVIDYNNDGGIVLEIKAPAGSPETLAASRDTYLSLSEAGAYALTAVPNDDPPPAAPANHVHIWVLVTDATELTAANLANGVASFPCFGPTIGARTAVIEDLSAITTRGADPTDPLPLTNGATIAASKEVTGDITTKVTTGTVIALGQSEAGVGFTGVAGSVALLPQGAKISANKTLEIGQATPASVGKSGRSAEGDQLYHNGSNVQAPGIAVSTQQIANTGSAASITTLTTTTRQDAPVSLYVTVEVYISRAASGSVTLTIEEDNGVDGGGQIWSALGSGFVTPNITTAFSFQRFTRIRIADSTPRYFRLVAAGGGQNIDIKEALLRVYQAGA